MDWLLRLEAHPDDRSVRMEFEAWRSRPANEAAFDEIRRVWSRLDGLAAPAGESEPGAPPSMPAIAAARSTRPSLLRRSLALAAIVLIGCAAMLSWPALQLQLEADHLTGTAETRTLRLEDGSLAMLDARSAVAVKFTAGRREIVLLNGNAFFEVVPSTERPFVVRAGDVAVTVVGTAFAVQANPRQVSVSVQSGIVRVAGAAGAPPATLTRGERLTIDRVTRHDVRSEVQPEDVASWRDGRLVVHNMPLRAVADELGRYHSGMIVFQDSAMADRLVNGVFNLRRPVEALSVAVDTQNGRIRSITPYVMLVSGK
jgi:transmembrane sensor